MTPADLCHDLVLASVVDQAKRWLPWGTYRERDFRAVLSPPQMGFVIGRSAHVFPIRLREGGVDTTSLKREIVDIGKRGAKSLHLAVKPVAVVMPRETWATWLEAWPGAITSPDDTPDSPKKPRYAEVPARVADYLRSRPGGTALPDEIMAGLTLSRGAVMNSRRAPNITSRRIIGGANRKRLYLVEEGYEVPDLAPREDLPPRRVSERRRGGQASAAELVALIRERGTITRVEAINALDVSEGAVMRAIEEAGCITTQRRGRFVHLTLDD
jgi:hypothetical protein